MENKGNYIVMIPARGGSKSIPYKNIKTIAGQPLIYWTLDAAVNSSMIKYVYVSTDSETIRNCVLQYNKPYKDKIRVVERSREASSDTASTEDVMLDFSQRVDYQNMVLIQCTNPMVTTADIDRAIEVHHNCDSVLSTVVQKRFYWERLEDQSIKEINHDIRNRPRRQDWNGVLAENGSVYVISKEAFLQHRCRLCGKIGTVVMDSDSYYEIDEPTDWLIVETLLKHKYGIK